VLPEPIQVKLTLEDERVVEVLPRLGYVHRGIEKGGEINEYPQNIFLVERVCGICSFIHACTYCSAIEKLMGVQVPERAAWLRTFWSELSRIQSHLLWIGLFADSFGFENLFMQAWRVREQVMDCVEMTSGNRVIPSTCTIGGVRRDLDADLQKAVLGKLADAERQLPPIFDALLMDYTVKKRNVGKGVLSGEDGLALGATGPTLRGSGVANDLRMTGYGVYKELDFHPVVEKDGDCYARARVRALETLQSFELVRKSLEKVPEGEIAVKVTGKPPASSEALFRQEQPRGEIIYYVKGNGTNNLERLRIRTPTYANLVTLLRMLPGCEMADVPVIILSIDPCISCTER
jgi:ech hydrogenase subunit E